MWVLRRALVPGLLIAALAGCAPSPSFCPSNHLEATFTPSWAMGGCRP